MQRRVTVRSRTARERETALGDANEHRARYTATGGIRSCTPSWHARPCASSPSADRGRPGRGEAQSDRERRERGSARSGPTTEGLPRWWRQIVRTKAESQRIVATRPLCRVQYPVPYSSRLQVIHRAGSGNCDRSRLMQYGCAWLPPRGNRFPSGRDSNLEAFSYNPAHGSFAASPFPAAAIPMVRIGGSSRTEPNYR